MIKTASLFQFVKIFWFAIPTTLIILGTVWFYLGSAAALTTAFLIILEITFSFENAVINAKVLIHMSVFWQRIFLSVGILIAVFGIMIVFPLALVSVTAGLSPGDVLKLALNRPDEYAAHLEEAQTGIASFGGMFLLMVFLSFLLMKIKDQNFG